MFCKAVPMIGPLTSRLLSYECKSVQLPGIPTIESQVSRKCWKSRHAAYGTSRRTPAVPFSRSLLQFHLCIPDRFGNLHTEFPIASHSR
ncbi:hypothetical protein VTN96DRAFT_2984 [Rasamsonia emersonii]